MKHFLKKALGTAIAIPLAIGLTLSIAQADKIHIALAETPSDELAAFLNEFLVHEDGKCACPGRARDGGE